MYYYKVLLIGTRPSVFKLLSDARTNIEFTQRKRHVKYDSKTRTTYTMKYNWIWYIFIYICKHLLKNISGIINSL